MKILYIGDVMGKAGREVVAKVLPDLKKKEQIDFVIAQAENSNDNGKGPRPSDLQDMQAAGVDFFTGGNHSFTSPETSQLYADDSSPLIRPANVEDMPGKGYEIVKLGNNRILIATILGQTVGSQKVEIINPLNKIDEIFEKEEGNFDLSIVNFHGDFSSEKIVFGHYLDGRATAVVGDHWHVPTADAQILPGGTAHITDVGMCGALHSSLGVKSKSIIERWKTGQPTRNEMEETDPYQFNALLISIEDLSNTVEAVSLISKVI